MPRESPADRVAHVREVVVAVAHLRAEPAVLLLRRPAVLEDDHRAHDVGPLDVAHVVALDPLRRALDVEVIAERLVQLDERFLRLAAVGEPAHALLTEGVDGVPRRELDEVPLLAALRDEEP